MNRLKTLTVAELMDVLRDQDPDARVIFSTDYGDYGHTPQALPIGREVDTVTIEKSGYSTSGFAIARDDDDDPDATYEPYLVIGGNR